MKFTSNENKHIYKFGDGDVSNFTCHAQAGSYINLLYISKSGKVNDNRYFCKTHSACNTSLSIKLMRADNDTSLKCIINTRGTTTPIQIRLIVDQTIKTKDSSLKSPGYMTANGETFIPNEGGYVYKYRNGDDMILTCHAMAGSYINLLYYSKTDDNALSSKFCENSSCNVSMNMTADYAKSGTVLECIININEITDTILLRLDIEEDVSFPRSELNSTDTEMDNQMEMLFERIQERMDRQTIVITESITRNVMQKSDEKFKKIDEENKRLNKEISELKDKAKRLGAILIEAQI